MPPLRLEGENAGKPAGEPLQAAMALVSTAFRPEEWDEELQLVAGREIARVMAHGAVAELALNAAALRDLAKNPKRAAAVRAKLTSAQEIAERLQIARPSGVSLDFPDWLKSHIAGELEELFKQPYWLEINKTTLADVANIVSQGMLEGRSIATIARAIRSKHSGYTLARARNVARTETSSAANSGHQLAIRRMQEETGLPVGKEWLSVMGSTTRDTHAAADGQVVDTPDGLFELAGYKVPYPAHHSLPARERCQCQCTIISAIVMEAARDEAGEEDKPVKPAEVEKPEQAVQHKPPTPEELAKMPILEAVAKADNLEAKRVELLKAADRLDAEERRIEAAFQERVGAIRAAYSAKDEAPNAAALAEAERRVAELEAELAPLRKSLADIKKDRKSLAVTYLAPPKDERARWKVELSAGTNEKIDGLLQSTGKFTRAFKAKAKNATDFLSRMVARRPVNDLSPDLFAKRLQGGDLRFHAQERGSRAFYRGHGINNAGIPDYGAYLSDTTPEHVFVHELTHHLEKASGLASRSEEFRKARIGSAKTKDKRFVDVLPNHNFRPEEFGNEDHFEAVYKGRNEPESLKKAMYAGKGYKGTATEILTMGVEELYRDPVNFARADPEWFKYVVGCLDGTIRQRVN